MIFRMFLTGFLTALGAFLIFLILGSVISFFLPSFTEAVIPGAIGCSIGTGFVSFFIPLFYR